MTEHRDYTAVKVIRVLFGDRLPEPGETKDELNFRIYCYQILLIVSAVVCQMWKQAKWIDIRDSTQDLPRGSSGSKRMRHYLELKSKKEIEDISGNIQSAIIQRIKERRSKSKGKNKKLKRQMLDTGARGNDNLKALKKDIQSFLPTLVIWMLRILMAFQGYMYHSYMGLTHIAWVILSFLFPIKLVLCLSIVIMVPMTAVEFLIVYGDKIPLV
jgi:hypothetical protein